MIEEDVPSITDSIHLHENLMLLITLKIDVCGDGKQGIKKTWP